MAALRPGRAFALGLAVVLAIAGPVLAAGRVDCQAERAGQRALVHVSAAELFDRELLRLVELGLVGRVHVELTLVRPRRFWFAARIAEAARAFTITYARDSEEFSLDGQRLADPRAFSLPPLALHPGPTGLAGGHVVDVRMRLEVITPSSLGQVARWLVTPAAGEEGRPVERSTAGVLPRAIVDYLAKDLARTARGGCPVR